jgi:predicted phosphodiesterase
VSIAVISDLHLGARPATDSFGHEDGEFLRFLRFLERNFERVVLLGDIWETLTGALPHRPSEELRLARERHPELAAQLRRPIYTFVHGNHDLVASHVDDAPSELRLRSGGVRLLFAHGHQGDALVMKARPVSELGVWLGGWIRRAGMHAAYKLLDRLDQRHFHDAEAAKPSRVERWAVGRAADVDADIVVTGHTHVACTAEHGRHLFLNSGSCSEGRISYLSIEPRLGRYLVHTSY